MLLLPQVSLISKKLKNMNIGQQIWQQTGSSTIGQLEEVSCVYCSEGHTFDNFPFNPASVNYMRNQNRWFQFKLL